MTTLTNTALKQLEELGGTWAKEYATLFANSTNEVANAFSRIASLAVVAKLENDTEGLTMLRSSADSMLYSLKIRYARENAAKVQSALGILVKVAEIIASMAGNVLVVGAAKLTEKLNGGDE